MSTNGTQVSEEATLPVIKGSRPGRQRALKAKNLGPYALMQTLGAGEYGKVKYGIHLESKQEVAVKLIRKESTESETRRNKIEREIRALERLQHPNIIKLYDMIETEKYFAVVLEYVPGGELFEYIQIQQGLSEEEAQYLFAQLISSVRYMHRKKIVHRDLKLENLLLGRNKHLMVTDFGFANFITKDGLMRTSCGSPCYAAPELVLNGSRGRYTGPAVDVWSCGVILYAMLCGHLPYGDDPDNPEGQNVGRLYRYILTSAAPQFPLHLSPDATDLLRQMLTPDPSQRCTLGMVTRHPWLRSQTCLLSKSADELEREANLVKPALLHTRRPASATNDDASNNEPEHTLKKMLIDNNNDNPEKDETPLQSWRQERIKSLYRSRTGSQPNKDRTQAFHSLRSRFKGSVRKSSCDEAVALERDTSSSYHPRLRRYSTLGQTTRRRHVVSRPPSTPALPMIETPTMSVLPNKKDDRQGTEYEHQQRQTGRMARKKVMQWFKRIVQSEENEDMRARGITDSLSNNTTVTTNTTTTRVMKHVGESSISSSSSAQALPPSSGSSNRVDEPEKKMPEDPLPVYRGLVDQSTLTLCSPKETIIKACQILVKLGINCDPIPSGFKMVCIRKAKHASLSLSNAEQKSTGLDDEGHPAAATTTATEEESQEPIYGDPDIDPGDQVEFVVEICRLYNVPNLHVVHARRLRGSDGAFKFVYRKLTGFLEIVGLTVHTPPDRSAAIAAAIPH